MTPLPPLSAEEEALFRGATDRFGYIHPNDMQRVWATLDAARATVPAGPGTCFHGVPFDQPCDNERCNEVRREVGLAARPVPAADDRECDHDHVTCDACGEGLTWTGIRAGVSPSTGDARPLDVKRLNRAMEIVSAREQWDFTVDGTAWNVALDALAAEYARLSERGEEPRAYAALRRAAQTLVDALPYEPGSMLGGKIALVVAALGSPSTGDAEACSRPESSDGS